MFPQNPHRNDSVVKITPYGDVYPPLNISFEGCKVTDYGFYEKFVNINGQCNYTSLYPIEFNYYGYEGITNGWRGNLSVNYGDIAKIY